MPPSESKRRSARTRAHSEDITAGKQAALDSGPAIDASSERRGQQALRGIMRYDFPASLVVFLVALPLCAGIAVACGVPVELGLITGVVGGIVAGALPGSRLQVSGPAAGLTVLVFEAVQRHGLAALGIIVFAAGLLQIGMGVARLGRWFRAMSLSVVQGMLAGIGVLLILGQLYTLADHRSPGAGLSTVVSLPRLFNSDHLVPLALGGGTLAVMIGWRRLPQRWRILPAPLVAVLLTTATVASFDLPVARLDVEPLLDSILVLGIDQVRLLGDVSILGTALALALIASAESLFGAAAVDRMHDGPPTRYDAELIAQGVGNTVCGVVGALPMTAVIVRSAANVRAGARSRASTVLHGVWLLCFAILAPGLLAPVPVTALAAVLLDAGWSLIVKTPLRTLWRRSRGESVILVATAVAVVALNLLEGVLIGLALAVIKLAWDSSTLHVQVRHHGDTVHVSLRGRGTFLRMPALHDALDSVPPGRSVHVDVSTVGHLDRACAEALREWAQRYEAGGGKVLSPEASRQPGTPTPAIAGYSGADHTPSHSVQPDPSH